MKVYACPKDVVFEGIDYANYDPEQEDRKIQAHQAALKTWLINAGHVGEHTGKVVYFPVADGQAQYMVGQSSRSMCLIHLPYGDAWHYPYIERLTKSDILSRIKSHEAMAKLFGRGPSDEDAKEGGSQRSAPGSRMSG